MFRDFLLPAVPVRLDSDKTLRISKPVTTFNRHLGKMNDLTSTVSLEFYHILFYAWSRKGTTHTNAIP